MRRCICAAECLLVACISVCQGLDHILGPSGWLGNPVVSLRGGQESRDHAGNIDMLPGGSFLPPPDGFHVEHNVVSEETWKILQNWLQQDKSIPWEIGAPKRTVAQFGCRYNYDTSQVEHVRVHPIPLILRKLLLEACATTKVLDILARKDRRVDPALTFTQCIINVYQADDIIPWHWDHVDFGPTVLVFTFGEARPLQMRRLLQPRSASLPQSPCHYNEKDYEYYTATPRHGSCYLLSGPSRYPWEHSVPPGSRFRLSITFRSHQQTKR